MTQSGEERGGEPDHDLVLGLQRFSILVSCFGGNPDQTYPMVQPHPVFRPLVLKREEEGVKGVGWGFNSPHDVTSP